jgi:hypothetical protein
MMNTPHTVLYEKIFYRILSAQNTRKSFIIGQPKKLAVKVASDLGNRSPSFWRAVQYLWQMKLAK